MSLVVIDKNELEQTLKNIIEDVFSKHFTSDQLSSGIQQDDLIQITDVAEILNVSLSTVHSYKRQGLFPFYRVGRRIYFKREEVINGLKKVHC